MKCDNCHRDIWPGERYFTESHLEWRRSSDEQQFDQPADEAMGYIQRCEMCLPGHVKRAMLGITEIPGAAHLTGRGK